MNHSTNVETPLADLRQFQFASPVLQPFAMLDYFEWIRRSFREQHWLGMTQSLDDPSIFYVANLEPSFRNPNNPEGLYEDEIGPLRVENFRNRISLEGLSIDRGHLETMQYEINVSSLRYVVPDGMRPADDWQSVLDNVLQVQSQIESLHFRIGHKLLNDEWDEPHVDNVMSDLELVFLKCIEFQGL